MASPHPKNRGPGEGLGANSDAADFAPGRAATRNAAPARPLMQAMPLCRHSTSPTLPAQPGPTAVRLSHYVVARRLAPRAANDNRRPRAVPAWPGPW